MDLPPATPRLLIFAAGPVGDDEAPTSVVACDLVAAASRLGLPEDLWANPAYAAEAPGTERSMPAIAELLRGALAQHCHPGNFRFGQMFFGLGRGTEVQAYAVDSMFPAGSSQAAKACDDLAARLGPLFAARFSISPSTKNIDAVDMARRLVVALQEARALGEATPEATPSSNQSRL